MNIDITSLAFGYSFRNGSVGTPNWSTAMGQGSQYKINDSLPGLTELMKGLIYKAVSLNGIVTRMGHGGAQVVGASADPRLVLAAVFDKVYVNETLIDGARFVLLVTKDQSPSHSGRLKLMYSKHNAYAMAEQPEYKNDELYSRLIPEKLGLAENACWFVSAINVRHQDELVFTAHIVNSDGPAEYDDVAEMKKQWKQLVPETLLLPETEEDTPEETPAAISDAAEKNLLFYGVPGCGKSYKIKSEYCDDARYMERVVFHPDYTYSDFIGQLLPQGQDGKVKYEFEPGPFTRILKKAVEDVHHPYYLVIEEINRGNAPAIFGDVFQLLDRVRTKDLAGHPDWKVGESIYGVNQPDVAAKVYGAAEHPVKLPSNLYILATMNTADQNVFTMDTAFKRRWKMKSVKADWTQCALADSTIAGTGVTWRTFVETINELIVSESANAVGSEDKRLGPFFITEEEDLLAESFAEKVLMYLWTDAFKYAHERLFKSEYKTLEQLSEAFAAVGFAVFAEGISFPQLTAAGTLLPEDSTAAS